MTTATTFLTCFVRIFNQATFSEATNTFCLLLTLELISAILIDQHQFEIICVAQSATKFFSMWFPTKGTLQTHFFQNFHCLQSRDVEKLWRNEAFPKFCHNFQNSWHDMFLVSQMSIDHFQIRNLSTWSTTQQLSLAILMWLKSVVLPTVERSLWISLEKFQLSFFD